MSDITLAPTDNWQAAFREFDGYGNITLHGGTGTRLSGLDIGARALHSSDIFFESGSVLDCNQGLREQGGRIRASQSKVIFAGNNTDRIIVPVDAI